MLEAGHHVRGHTKLQAASINRELSLLRRGYQLGYERKPQLVDRIPPIKKLAENNVRKGFLNPDQYRVLSAELPAHLREQRMRPAVSRLFAAEATVRRPRPVCELSAPMTLL